MTGAAAAFAISLVAALAGMFPAVMIFRWLKTGVRSQFIPDRKQLKDQVRTVGAGSAALVGLLAASAACMPLIPAEERNAGGVFSAAVFCVMLFLAGFADDWLTDIKGYAAGLRPGMRIVFTGVCGLVFSNLYLAFGGNTVVTLPFAQGAVRINGFFCPVVDRRGLRCKGGHSAFLCSGCRSVFRRDSRYGVFPCRSRRSNCGVLYDQTACADEAGAFGKIPVFGSCAGRVRYFRLRKIYTLSCGCGDTFSVGFSG